MVEEFALLFDVVIMVVFVCVFFLLFVFHSHKQSVHTHCTFINQGLNEFINISGNC